MLEWSENLYLELYLGRWINVQVISGIRCGGPSWCGDPPQKPTDWDLTFEGEGDGAAHGGLRGGNRHPKQGRRLCLWDFHHTCSWTQTHRSHRRMCSHNMNLWLFKIKSVFEGEGIFSVMIVNKGTQLFWYCNVVLFTPNKVLNLHTNNQICWDLVRCHQM